MGAAAEGRLTGIGGRKVARKTVLSLTFAALCAAGIALSAAVIRSDTGNADWPLYGRDSKEQRFAELDRINTGNVGKLGLAWYHEFDTDRAQTATPIMVDGVLYLSTAWSKVYAFDARTGRQVWQHDPEVPRETLVKTCCDATNRGVAVDSGRVFVGTLDGRLQALDARSGKVIWSVVTVDQSKDYTITGAPKVAGNLVLIGNGGAEYGVRGYISAYDVATGKLVWRFYTTPNPEGKADGQPSDRPLRDLAAPTWFGNGWKESGGGGTVWDSFTYDPETGILYVGVGNAGPYDRQARSEGKGDNLFVSSILALKAATGEYLWHYQETPGDSWDYTATQHMMLLDREIDGRPRKLLVQAPKNGFFYVLDRITGELISAQPYAKMTWATGVDMKTGRPIEAPGAHYRDAPALIQPASFGAHSWHPMAYSPKTGLVYVPAQVMGQLYSRDTAYKFRPGHLNVGVDTRNLRLPDDPKQIEAMKAGAWGEVIAWDPVAQKARWTVKHPYLVNGGLLATAGNLLFQGTGEGQFNAYDATDGRRLWSYQAGNGITAAPISYELDGKQYVAVLVGYGGPVAMIGTIVPYRLRLPGRLLVFALGGKAKAPPFDIPAPQAVDLAEVHSSGDAEAGQWAYNDNCMVCHGFSASGRYTADLRRSEMIKDPEAFRSVVIDGSLSSLGMVSFAKFLSPADAENVRAYLIGEGRRLEAAEKPRSEGK
jgi:PQQ-dependent dehydrogenase (methanol/ethanol family)